MNRAEQLKPVLGELVAAGMSARQIAAELTTRGVPTPRGGRWHPQTVTRVMERVSNGRSPKPGKSAFGGGADIANWNRDVTDPSGGTLGHASITNTVHYTAMSPEPFKDIWRGKR